MQTRRLILAGLLSGLALPALAQGRKSGGPPDALTRPIAGAYTARGLNADGTAYSGTVEIVEQGMAIEMTWQVAGDTIRGQGIREGRIVTVDWGDKTPVVYVLMPDGSLHGTWDDGTALEKLTRR